MTTNALTPVVDKFFREFLFNLNKQMLHPREVDRFFVFVNVCHLEGVRLLEEDLRPLLAQEGLLMETVDDLVRMYSYGWQTLEQAPRAAREMGGQS